MCARVVHGYIAVLASCYCMNACANGHNNVVKFVCLYLTCRASRGKYFIVEVRVGDADDLQTEKGW